MKADGQLDFPFPLDPPTLAAFLGRVLAIEDEQDRLREELRLLKEEYTENLPIRALLTAIKVVRARDKLEHHPKEPLALVHQGFLEHAVESFLMGRQASMAALQADMQHVLSRETGN